MLKNVLSATILGYAFFSRGISREISTWHMCFRIRASDRGKSRLVHPSYRKVLRAHELSHCANAHRRCRIFGRETEIKSSTYTRSVMRMIFFKTVILLYDHRLFHARIGSKRVHLILEGHIAKMERVNEELI